MEYTPLVSYEGLDGSDGDVGIVLSDMIDKTSDEMATVMGSILVCPHIWTPSGSDTTGRYCIARLATARYMKDLSHEPTQKEKRMSDAAAVDDLPFTKTHLLTVRHDILNALSRSDRHVMIADITIKGSKISPISHSLEIQIQHASYAAKAYNKILRMCLTEVNARYIT